jgi:hypothetical protein
MIVGNRHLNCAENLKPTSIEAFTTAAAAASEAALDSMRIGVGPAQPAPADQQQRLIAAIR